MLLTLCVWLCSLPRKSFSSGDAVLHVAVAVERLVDCLGNDVETLHLSGNLAKRGIWLLFIVAHKKTSDLGNGAQ